MKSLAIRRLWSPPILGTSLLLVVPLSGAYAGIRWALLGEVRVGLTVTVTLLLWATFVLGYSLFFWAQGRAAARGVDPKLVHPRALDDWFPNHPAWVWVYSVGYYGFIGLPLAVVDGLDEAGVLLGLGLASVGLAAVAHVRAPASLPAPWRYPDEWREHDKESPTWQLLALVKGMDLGTSCNPSLHAALSVYIAIVHSFGWWSLVMPVVVMASCLGTRQHVVDDFRWSIPLGVVLGLLGRWWLGAL